MKGLIVVIEIVSDFSLYAPTLQQIVRDFRIVRMWAVQYDKLHWECDKLQN